MKLKILIFPLMLAASFAFFMYYAWPEIVNLKSIKEEKSENNQLLQDIKNKKLDIERIGNQISEDKDSSNAVLSYLPVKKMEERIVGGVNYLAIDSGVALANLSLKDISTENPGNTARQNPASDKKEKEEIINTMKFSEATILANGGYEKIKLFVDQLQKIFLFNNIKSLTISSEQNSSENANSLLATAVVDFGYIAPSKMNNSRIANFKPEFDKSTIDTLKQYVLQKTETVNRSSSKGKANPFLP